MPEEIASVQMIFCNHRPPNLDAEAGDKRCRVDYMQFTTNPGKKPLCSA
jgi:hypothetical protein